MAHRIAGIFVGVNNGLRLAENDALDLWGLVSSGAGPFRGDGARLLLGKAATSRAVDGALASLAEAQPDIVLFGFAGHANERGLLVGGERLYPYRRLLDRLRDSGATRQLVILDACRAGAFADLARTTKVAGLGGMELMTDPAWLATLGLWPRGLRVVTSARAGQAAFESTSATARNGYFTASFLHHARTLSGDLPTGAISDDALIDCVTDDLRSQSLPQTPVVWGGPTSIPIVHSEHDRQLGRAMISSLRPEHASLVVNIGTAGRRFLPTSVRVSVVSTLTGTALTWRHRFVPMASLAVEPLRLDASSLTSDSWHLGLARHGYTLEWSVSVTDDWGRLLANSEQPIAYRAA